MNGSKISISGLEKAVINKDFATAESILIEIFNGQLNKNVMMTLPPKGRNLTEEQENIEFYQIIEKLASSITQLFSQESYMISSDGFLSMVNNKKLLSLIFQASAYFNTDHILSNLGLDKKTSFTKTEIEKMLVLFMPSSSFSLPWKLLAENMPAQAAQAYTATVATNVLLVEEKAAKNIDDLAGIAEQLPLVKAVNPSNLNKLFIAYFGLSNLTGVKKYAYKRWAVKCMSKMLESYLSNTSQQKISEITKAFKLKAVNSSKKPKLVVCIEVYKDGHAMYRCYHTILIALKEYFDVVAVFPKGAVKGGALFDFDNFKEIEDGNVQTMVDTILAEKPDIILYPSIGMNDLVTYTSILRLAPLQFSLMGHPSSSYSPNIDYAILHDMGLPREQFSKYFEEQLLFTEGEFNPMGCNSYELVDQSPSNTIKIAVNGVIQKVTHDLIEVCQKITEKSGKHIEFQFFLANSRQGMEFFAAQSLLRRYLPNSKIHKYQSYNDYMNVLNGCTLAIPTIPFGGTNSNMDCLRLNLPKLFIIDERDYSGFTDYQFWYAKGLLDGYCKDKEQLIEKAILLVENEPEVQRFKENLKQFDLDSYNKKAQESKPDSRIAELIYKVAYE